MVGGSNLSWQGIERQCTLERQAWYVNVWGSVHWKGSVQDGGVDIGDAQIF